MRTLRIDRRLTRWLNVSLGGKLRAVTVDASASGFCAELDAVFLPGSRVHGDLQVSDRVFPFRGVVTWAQPGSRLRQERSRIGVAFEQIADDFAHCLDAPQTAR
jgi:hypothetical protein